MFNTREEEELMRDHKDITDYRTLPAIEIPASMVRRLNAAECLAKADEMEERSQGWLDPKDRKADLKEAREWRRLAADRSAF